MTSKSYLANSSQPALAAKNVSDTQTLINYKYNCTVSIDVKGYSSKYVDKKIFFLQSLHKGAEKALDGMGRIHCRHEKKCVQSATHHSTLKKRQSSYIYTCKQNLHRKLTILVLNLFYSSSAVLKQSSCLWSKCRSK